MEYVAHHCVVSARCKFGQHRARPSYSPNPPKSRKKSRGKKSSRCRQIAPKVSSNWRRSAADAPPGRAHDARRRPGRPGLGAALVAQGCGGEWEGSHRGARGFRGAARARRRRARSAALRVRGEADRGRLGGLGVRRGAVAARPGAADRDDRALGRRALAAVVARDVVPQADGALELGVLGGAAGVAASSGSRTCRAP